ncbi:MAG: (Fe-S)-binding protein [Thermoplasmata archaeon]|nr:MAG: (Fe-S)-binding protein [Thermoplasmata archaeon]
MITEQYKELVRGCEQCGTCTACCPTSEVSDFNIRKVVRHLQLDMHEEEEFLNKYPWLCTLCYRCSELCYEGLEVPRLISALRKLALEKKSVPEAVLGVLDNVKENDSPYKSTGKPKSSRINSFLKPTPDAEILFWIGCTPSMKAANIAKATADVLLKTDNPYKVLDEEPCCGEPLVCLGFEDEARAAAEHVKAAIEDADVKRVVTPCSGCNDAFNRLYPEKLDVEFSGIEVLHSTQFLCDKVDGFKLPEPMKVTFHDPCTLGRHTGEYEAPRKLLNSIEGITLIEMERTKQFGGCCGGGGGLPSVELNASGEIAKRMLERDVLPLGVDALVSCCPMCNLNFRFAAKKNKLPLKVYDISEILNLCLTD